MVLKSKELKKVAIIWEKCPVVSMWTDVSKKRNCSANLIGNEAKENDRCPIWNTVPEFAGRDWGKDDICCHNG
jgi:hypothetical protein